MPKGSRFRFVLCLLIAGYSAAYGQNGPERQHADRETPDSISCDVGPHEAADSTIRIGEVVVMPRFIRQQAGRYTVSLAGNPLSKDRFLGEVLTLLPGVRRENGEYKVDGRDVSAIRIDGRRASLAELNALPAENIASVEVRRASSGAQDAAARGAELHVRLRRLSDGGYMGSVSLAAASRDDGFSNTSFDMPVGMKYGKFDFYNFASYRFFDEVHRYGRHSEYRDPVPTVIFSDEEERTLHHTVTEKFNLLYEAAPRHSVGVSGNFSYASSSPKMISDSRCRVADAEVPTSQRHYESLGTLDDIAWQTTVSYLFRLDTLGSELKVDADYLSHKTDKEYFYDNRTEDEPPARLHEAMHPSTELFRSKVDWLQLFGESMSLNTGAEYYRYGMRRNSTVEDAGLSGEAEKASFRYRGQGAAFYSELGGAWGRFDLRAGLRLQWDRLDHFTDGDDRWRRKDYLRLIPNVSVSYAIEPDKGTSFAVDYTRDDGYIPYESLSPLKVRETEYTYRTGNTDLRPSRGYDLGAVLTLREKWTLAYNYSRGTDLIANLIFLDPDDPQQTYTRPENCATQSLHSLDLYYTARMTRWLHVNWNLSGYRSHYAYRGTKFSTGGAGVYLTNSIRFAENCGMTVEFVATTPDKKMEYRHNGTYALNASLYARFFKKRIHAELSCTNISANKNIVDTWNREETYLSRMKHLSSSRTFRLSVSYVFNNYRGIAAPKRSRTLQEIKNEYK
ncbi:outer membrane beta-barrel family protein [uncultured Alistipes sp.]|uniref:outer membrane beta-barrel family protein n=1 Tax=uncultured Alistipes sp. TaxID=538949 RepID=UPI00272989EF|nr:outer membrane beta-barrel family protein [uncultured Alistipes sp.]